MIIVPIQQNAIDIADKTIKHKNTHIIIIKIIIQHNSQVTKIKIIMQQIV